MIDIRFLRENPDAVRENIRKKFQDEKLPLVDEAIRLDAEKRAAQQECEQLKAARNKLSKANGPLYGQLKKADEAQKAELQKQIEENNAKVKADDDRRAELEKKQAEAEDKLREIMYVIPNIIDPSVPIGPDDSHNVEVQRFGEPVVPDFRDPAPRRYHAVLRRHRQGFRRPRRRYGLLLSAGRHRPAARGRAGLRARFHDR